MRFGESNGSPDGGDLGPKHSPGGGEDWGMHVMAGELESSASVLSQVEANGGEPMLRDPSPVKSIAG